MDMGQISAFLHLLRCRQSSVSVKWVRATCPLAYRHSSGADKHPSFAISINPGDASNYRCLACGSSGTLISLLWRLDADGRPVPRGAFEFLQKHNQLDVDKIADAPPPAPDDFRGRVKASNEYFSPSTRVSTFVHPDDEPQASVPEEVLRSMVSALSSQATVLDYLMRDPVPTLKQVGRRLTKATIVEWELGWHPIERRICIPIRAVDGKLVAISGRLFEESSHSPKYLHSKFKRDRVLFGEHRHDPTLRAGYLFEGFFHVIYSWQVGYRNVLARMGTHLSRQQADRLVEWFDHLIIVPDGDKAGLESADRVKETLEGRIARVDIAPMLKGKDADGLPPDTLRAVMGPPF
jgi:hypothetical protein